MKKIDAFWVLPALLFGLHQAAQSLSLSNSWLRSYADDLLVIPLCLGLLDAFALRIHRPISGRRRAVYALIGIFWFGWFFEKRIPESRAGFTSDPADWIAYSAGAILYLAAISRLNPNKAKSNREGSKGSSLRN